MTPLWRSFVYAGRGVRILLWDERNGRIHFVAAILVIAVSAWLRLSTGEWCWIVAAIAAVWAAEGFNTAIEGGCSEAGAALLCCAPALLRSSASITRASSRFRASCAPGAFPERGDS
jgi:hypothetical protein